MSILADLDDPKLFGGHFRGPSWAAWRAFLAALFALPMNEAQLETYRRHTGRETAPTVPFREAALVIGRRGGKSRVLATIATHLATDRDYTPYLAPGEVATVAVIASDRKQARSIFRYIKGLLDAVPMLAAMVEDATQDAITLNNRVVIEIHTASFRVTRGYSFAAVLADETAYWRDENSATPDVEIFRALRPGMTSIPGAILLNASSPYRRAGVLWNAYRRYHGRDDARVLVWQATTEEMNPNVDPVVIAEAYEEDPISAAAEYGAQFRDDIAEFVSLKVVEACVVPGRYEMPKLPGFRYVAFVDPSGGSADSMTLAIAHADTKDRTLKVLDCVREIKPPFSPEAVVKEFAALIKSYGINRVTGDRYAGEWPRERFREHGITYDLSEKSKIEVYRDMLPLLNSGKVELLDLPRVTAQFCGLERRTARGGRDSIDHAPGGHDDVANAVAGALLLVATARGPMVISPHMLAISRMRSRGEIDAYRRAHGLEPGKWESLDRI